METLYYFIFSGSEWLAMVLLTFVMFKFPLRGYWGQIILTAIVMSFLSHFLFQVIDQRTLATILQPPVLFLLLWQVFRVHIFYSGLMTIYGYMGYLFAQHSVMTIFLWLGIPLEELIPNTLPLYLLQTSSILLVILAAGVLGKYRLGYSFVPDFEYVPVSLKGTNLKLLLFAIVGYFLIAVSNFVSFNKGAPKLIILISFIALGFLLYYAQRKEYAND
ncbi:hypothetical protein ACFOQM_09960 [Paenibacillus sp. GCM10012307]|uniref:Uncharacterized protein n=1 Tax=Paenibacillus roseus TaxID=2798579 RepID=A0A934J6F4_9BACL|nr:hypothetical protein [Paenibacillus roseus]MBJ6361611.1 hypothetical protein [Paenibacillus roseus]